MHLHRNAFVVAVEIEPAGNSLEPVSPIKQPREHARGVSAPMSTPSSDKVLANV